MCASRGVSSQTRALILASTHLLTQLPPTRRSAMIAGDIKPTTINHAKHETTGNTCFRRPLCREGYLTKHHAIYRAAPCKAGHVHNTDSRQAALVAGRCLQVGVNASPPWGYPAAVFLKHEHRGQANQDSVSYHVKRLLTISCIAKCCRLLICAFHGAVGTNLLHRGSLFCRDDFEGVYASRSRQATKRNESPLSVVDFFSFIFQIWRVTYMSGTNSKVSKISQTHDTNSKHRRNNNYSITRQLFLGIVPQIVYHFFKINISLKCT